MLNGGLHLDIEVLERSKLDEIGGPHDEAENNAQQSLCRSLAEIYSPSLETGGREIEGCSSWAV